VGEIKKRGVDKGVIIDFRKLRIVLDCNIKGVTK